MSSLQDYFEQQNDKEAASIVADVVALLPSNASVVNWKNQGDVEKLEKVEEMNENVVFNNILLTKESEIAALKEVIIKWRTRALEAESNAESYYLGMLIQSCIATCSIDRFSTDQLDFVHLQHEKELKSMEARYSRRLSEKDHVISHLEEQVGYLVSRRSSRDTDSFESSMDEDYEEDDDEDQDVQSIISSIYDRDAEQQLILIESRPTIYSNENTTNTDNELKSEAILDSIQDTMRAIEQELSSKTRNRHQHYHRRSPSNNTYFSSATLIDSAQSTMSENTTNTKKIKKSAFSFNRIFKKAFPKLYNKNNLKYSNNKKTAHSIFHDDTSCSFPRSSTDETLGVYSTTSTVTTNEESNIQVMNFKTLLNHQPQQQTIVI
ncbi:hypothetical protein MAM1_0187c07551 [Mucor ambiguus]|uniref:Uncharacterized protein n=1 Tax=Mucor ambiguus TaxID=91626 RepID=A0A0C9LW77_9FUNG|nr:hypothetical protein MAM1_0187c07551 [Mucor ambiguus]